MEKGIAEVFCQCGCGRRTKIQTSNNAKLGYVKGKPRRFISGHNSRIRKLSEEHKRRIGAANAVALLGRKMPEEEKESHRKNGSKFWLGKKLSKAHCEKMSQSHKKFYEEHPDYPGLFQKGRKSSGGNGKFYCEGSKSPRINLDQAGEKNPNWQGGISKLPYSFGFSSKFKESIRERDSFKCQICGNTGSKRANQYGRYADCLDVHHIDGNKSSLDENDFVSLCAECHSRIKSNRIFWMTFLKEKVTRNEYC